LTAGAGAAVPVGPGNLLIGALTVDVQALRQSADHFFTQLGDLRRTEPPWLHFGLTPWLVAAALATGAFEFARRQQRLSLAGGDLPEGWAARRWGWMLGVPVVPPEDE
jgi:hypothetical protein